jgi:hypothetical protein
MAARKPKRKTVRKRKGTTARKPFKTTAQNIELYSTAYRIAWSRISPLQKSEQPNLPLWLHASIRRQLKEGARDPFSIAFEALKDLAERSDSGTK